MKKELSTREMARLAVSREPWIVFEELMTAYTKRKTENLPHMSFWLKEFELWARILNERIGVVEVNSIKAEEEKLAKMSDQERLDYLCSKIQW